MKARGVGLTASLTEFSVDIDRDPPHLTWEDEAASDRQPDKNSDVWTLAFVPVDAGYVGAVAAKVSSVRLKSHRGIAR